MGVGGGVRGERDHALIRWPALTLCILGIFHASASADYIQN